MYENYDNETRLKDILKETDIVTILTYEEDAILNKTKLTSKMPPNWQIFKNSSFERYVSAGIEIPHKKIPVYGALAR